MRIDVNKIIKAVVAVFVAAAVILFWYKLGWFQNSTFSSTFGYFDDYFALYLFNFGCLIIGIKILKFISSGFSLRKRPQND